MLYTMINTLTAIFIGGDRDGTTVELKGAHPTIISTLAGATDGGGRVARGAPGARRGQGACRGGTLARG